MIHVTCDLCGKKVTADECYGYVVKIEVFPAQDPCKLTEADLDEDNMEAVSQILRAEEDDLEVAAPAYRNFRYELCSSCHKRFVRDPLSKEAMQKFHFSEN